jgi:hypothetical protein
MRKRTAMGVAAVLLFAFDAAARRPAPYDFTGRWSGTIVARGETFHAAADIASTRGARFDGTATVGGQSGSAPCGLRGKGGRRIRIVLRCDDGTRGRLTGALDATTDVMTGVARLRDRRGGRARGEFTLAKNPG